MRLSFVLSASLVTAAHAGITGGVFTADVEITSDVLFGGMPFAAVINPDAVDIYPGGTGPVNTSGYLEGPIAQPALFSYIELPVYAILDQSGAPIAYDTPLFADDGLGGQDLGAPLFTLSAIGVLSFEAVDDGGGAYELTAGVLETGLGSIAIRGSFQLDLPPWGEPNFLWYGLGANAVDFRGAVDLFSMASMDDQWLGNGWPGPTLDKNFFPVPAPATLAGLGLGVLATRRRR